MHPPTLQRRRHHRDALARKVTGIVLLSLATGFVVAVAGGLTLAGSSALLVIAAVVTAGPGVALVISGERRAPMARGFDTGGPAAGIYGGWNGWDGGGGGGGCGGDGGGGGGG